MVRIIAGEFKGRRLKTPAGDAVRPTGDRVREAWFSILQRPLRGARVLDLFAGSGALGIEALSRGAAAVTFVDSSNAAVATIRRNLESLRAPGEVRRQRALAFLDGARTRGRQYDLVFLDPPYRHATGLGPELSAALGPVLSSGARVVSESDKRAPLELELEMVDERRYGDTLIRIHVSPR